MDKIKLKEIVLKINNKEYKGYEGEYENSLPMVAGIGGSYIFKIRGKRIRKILTGLEVDAGIKSEEVLIKTGGEIEIEVNREITALGRLGFKVPTKDNGLGFLSYMNIGGGIKYKEYSMDIGFNYGGDTGSVIRISLKWLYNRI